jgi:hypothetical protein
MLILLTSFSGFQDRLHTPTSLSKITTAMCRYTLFYSSLLLLLPTVIFSAFIKGGLKGSDQYLPRNAVLFTVCVQ